MTFRDPDLGRDRATLALGRRDWGFFTSTADGLLRAERQPAAQPWSERPVTEHDRFDRTLGIPDRSTPMWPTFPLSLAAAETDAVRRAEALCDEICAQPFPEWPWPEAEVCAALLGDVASAGYARSHQGQAAAIVAAAHRHGVHPMTARNLVTGVGSLVGQTTHRAAAVPGVASINLIAGAEVTAATELFLARERLRVAEARSDADLPRLWILANGLAHGVPAAVMRRVPARSVGPITKLPRPGNGVRPEQLARARKLLTHDDLVGWDGARAAVEHLRDVVRAAAEGRRWLQRPERGIEQRVRDELALGMGVVALTRPATALQLARYGVVRLTFGQLRAAAGPAPAGVLDLSDDALKAVCDRNGWLLGAASERTERELVERHDPAMGVDELRAALAAGRAGPRDAFGASVPDDDALDARAFRKNPPAPDVAAAHLLVGVAGREAVRRFAEVEAPQRASFADALAHRFPVDRGRDVLCESDATRLLGAAPVLAASPAVALTLDLGL